MDRRCIIPQWLVKPLAIAGQPIILGGPKKSMKTTLLIDLAVSLASATPFLGHFVVPQSTRTILLSGESGSFTLAETARRVCAARGLRLAELGDRLLWKEELPGLGVQADMAVLSQGLRRSGCQTAMIDPLYLALMTGLEAGSIRAENLFQMGPLLLSVARACLHAGCTPILAHHFKLTRKDGFAEPELDDLAYAGIQEFARQWLLLSRRERYDPGAAAGSHRLWLAAGGSVGHGGSWALDIEEGQQDDDFSGRTWQVAVRLGSEARSDARAEEEKSKELAAQEKLRKIDGYVLAALDAVTARGEVPTCRKVRDNTQSMGSTSFDRAVERLAGQGAIEVYEVEAPMPRGGSKRAKALRRRCEAIDPREVFGDGPD